jgi:hypothetical protein
MSKIIVKDSGINMLWSSESTDTVALVNPDYYQDNGTPTDDDGEDMIYQHTEVEIPEVTIVSVIENNKIKNMYHFYDITSAEKKFKSLVKSHSDINLSERNLNLILEDGCFSNGVTCICFGQPE